VSSKYGGRDETCPVSTGGGTRRVRFVRGGDETGAAGARARPSEYTVYSSAYPSVSRAASAPQPLRHAAAAAAAAAAARSASDARVRLGAGPRRAVRC